MFGYIRVYKPDLKISEYETYKSIYCGLCQQLGQEYTPLANWMTLSFDFTFLAALNMALAEDKPVYTKRKCPANPLKKCIMADLGEIQSHCCDCAVLMLWYKLEDDLKDHGTASRLRAAALYPAARLAYRKAAQRRPELDQLIGNNMRLQAETEAACTASVDLASEPTAQVLSGLFSTLSEDPVQKRVLERLGYLLGRYVYLCDALDDLEDDREKGNYNPFLADQSAGTEQIETAIGTLYLTIAEAAKTFELLELKRFEPILANILYLGMKETVDSIVSKKGEIR